MIARFLEPYFTWFGQEVRLVLEQTQDSWVRLTLGHGTQERTFAIGLGYVVVAISLAFYLNIITAGNARNAGRVVRNAVRQQLLVVKACGRRLTLSHRLLSKPVIGCNVYHR